MRVLFVSDTHLGLDLPSHPRVSRPRRGPDFFRNFETALAPALRGEVDVVLHGGDLLFRSRVPGWLAAAALAPLKRVASAGVPVLLVPGNHERSRIPYPMLTAHERLTVFDRPKTVVLEARGLRVAFSGFPYAREVRRGFPSLLAATGRAACSCDVSVLCVHHCVEGATCGPGNFTFRDGPDVIRVADLPTDAAVTLSGHIHRHQVLRPRGVGPIVYAGSVERTSFAEAAETKGYVIGELTGSGLERVEFHPLPTRPMVTREVDLDGLTGFEALARVTAVLEGTPHDSVVQVRPLGPISTPAADALSAEALRAIAGDRNVSVLFPRAALAPRALERR